MFASGFVTLLSVALVAVNVVGYPVPMPIQVRCGRIYLDDVWRMLMALSARLG